MQIKRMSLRFDLDNPEDRQAWEYLRSLNTASMNRTVLSIINQAEQSARISGMVRSIIREELCAAPAAAPCSAVEEEGASKDGMDDTIMDFLKSFGWNAKIDVTFPSKFPVTLKLASHF